MTTKAIVSNERTITKLDPNIVCSLRDADNCKMAGDYKLYNFMDMNTPDTEERERMNRVGW